jgi:hypothetical protein
MRFNPFKLSDRLIEQKYKIPIPPDIIGVGEKESFMTAAPDMTVNLGEYLSFLRKCIYTLENDLKLYEEYHKAAHEIRNTTPRSEYKEGCRDTFGSGFFLEYDEYKDFREIYWKIQRLKNLEGQA